MIRMEERISKLEQQNIELLAAIEAKNEELKLVAEYVKTEMNADLAKRDQKRDAALLHEFAANCLPNMRRQESVASVERSIHNMAVDDCVKHALYLAAARESWEWVPKLEVK